ncbi:MAG: excinuclease ABC subunit UvrC [Brevinematales bacterium]|nr:excinuclease ABC subunit UvrC [Brevinematales bacterium]
MISKSFLKNIPETPGVYIMYSETGEVIYVGKSKNLRNRISSYFTSKNHSKRIQNLVNRIHKIDYIVVNNETEALILEANLIKKHKPRYNVLMKDSKFYPFIKMSKDEFPYIIATRKYEPSSNYEYFGPYTDNNLPYKLVDIIQRVFKIRTCKMMPKKACLNYYIDRCSAPCIGKISLEDYSRDASNAKRLLKGEVEVVIKDLENRMKEAAKELNFEKASHLRDSIFVLKELENQKQFVFNTCEDINTDYLSFSEMGELINFYVAHVVNGRFLGKQSITLRKDEEEDPLEKFLLNMYFEDDNVVLPKRICADVEIVGKVEEFFNKISKSVYLETVVESPIDEADTRMIEISKKNSIIILNEHFSRFEMEDKEIEELCRVLELENVSIIDGFDIANYGDEIAVGASVRFVDGMPFKKGYRLFNIETVKGQDDFGMMKEIVFRRYKREKENGVLPDLILIDGGKGQLNSAVSSLEKLQLEIPIVALAKEEEKIVTKDGREILLPRNSYALRLLQRVRDEAHRFGNTFVRNLKSKRVKKL